MSIEEYADFLILEGCKWVESERALHRPGSGILVDDLKLKFGSFFDPEILHCVRITAVPVIENPGFYTTLREMGEPVPFDLSAHSGITLQDTILISQEKIPPGGPPLALYFHELVHVVQYDILGVRGFVERYVRGWLENGQVYELIPLERTVYELHGRYEEDPEEGFSVVDEVLRLEGG
jgi:hypothetical protein